jgi:hypothetical protein
MTFMSGSHEATKPTPRSPRRWLRFSLRTLLIVMTLVCVGIVAKQQYDWHRRQQLIHRWIAPLVDLAHAADGDITRYPDDPPQLTPPAGLPAEEQIPLLRWGILELETPEERLAALKILVESHGEESLPVVRGLISECRHGELQATLLHLLSLERNHDDLPLFEKLLDSPSPVVRGAAAESIGYVKQPAYEMQQFARQFTSQLRLGTIPPIDVSFVSESPLRNLIRSGQGKGKQAPALTSETVPARLREALEARMLGGKTLEERSAAARALVGWPPDKYTLRIAEWGVWIDDRDRGHLKQAILEEIPPFVHTTGNPLTSLVRNRYDGPITITKPILHLTASCPLAVDIEIHIEGGRPWYVYPRPDALTVHAGKFLWKGIPKPADWDEQLEPRNLAALNELSEGYPWIHVADRGDVQWNDYDPHADVTAVGLRWQSLILSPERAAWMQLPAVPDDPKFRWWDDLREVPSAWVTSRGETERFLYYDGPTMARTPLKATLDGATLRLMAKDVFDSTSVTSRQFPDPFDRKSCLFIDTQQSPPRAFAFRPVEMFGLEEKLPLADQTWVRGDEIEPAFLELLLQQGLTKEEAAGLLDSWRERFFQTRGQRLLTLLTPAEYDRMCPLKVRPPATETVRVGVVLREF